jgi:superfamily II DNA or RNA helicase
MFDRGYISTALRFPPSHPFQDNVIEQLRQGARDGHKNQMLMSPTGSGKTLIALRIAAEALDKNKRVILLCDRTTLIDQTSAMADRCGLVDHGVIQANHWRTNYSRRLQIASLQTLASRGWPLVDLIIIDEAHTQMKVWTEHIVNCNAHVIGMSATPFSPGLAHLFTNLVNATTIHELVHTGVLVPLRILTCTPIDMLNAATSNGEWTDDAAAARGMAIVGDVVRDWIKYGEGRKTIVFGATIAHCEALCRRFSESGVRAAVFTARTTSIERAELLEEFRKVDSTIRVLISVEALAKGFDVPDVGCIVDSRPLRKSMSTAMQMWGRGQRSSLETGKKDCILLDHSGNIRRFADDYAKIFWKGLDRLDAGQALDQRIRKEPDRCEDRPCPECGFELFKTRCLSCGFESVRVATIESLPGRMKEFHLRKEAPMPPVQVWLEICAYVRLHGKPGKQQGRAASLFKSLTGSWPPQGWHIDSTSAAEPSQAVLNRIQHYNIAHAKRKRSVAP